MDLQILDCLLKFPKKKQIRKLFQHCFAINNQQKSLSYHFSTPTLQILSSQIGLSSQEVHRLVLSIINLFKIATFLNFDQDRLNNLLSENLNEQLKELIVGILLSFAENIKQIQSKKISQGKYLDFDNMDWNLGSQIGNQKGKSGISIVELSLPLKQRNQEQTRKIKFQMKGEQFEVFFNNLKKIKQTLNELITQS